MERNLGSLVLVLFLSTIIAEPARSECATCPTTCNPCPCSNLQTSNVSVYLFATYHAVTISATFEGDNNFDNDFSFLYSLTGPPYEWKPGMKMVRPAVNSCTPVTDTCDRGQVWRGQVYPLNPESDVWIQVSWRDCDNGGSWTSLDPIFVTTKSFPVPSPQTVYYADAEAPDCSVCSTCGTDSTPWPSLQQAVDCIKVITPWPSEGIRLVVRPGVYREKVRISDLSAPTASAPLIIDGLAGDPPTPDAIIDNSTDVTQAQWTEVASGLWRTLLPLAGGEQASPYLSTVVVDGKRTLGYMKLDHSTLPDITNDEFSLSRVFFWEGWPGTANSGGGAACSSTSCYLYLRTGDSNPPGTKVAQHSIYYTTAEMRSVCEDSGLEVRGSSNIIVRGLTIRYSGGPGVAIRSGASRILVTDCKIHDNRNDVVIIGISTADVAIWNNEIGGTGVGDYPWRAVGPYPNAGDPAYTDSAGYPPTASSPNHKMYTPVLVYSNARGTSIVNNRIYGGFDLLAGDFTSLASPLQGDTDIFWNFFSEAGDDAVELDRRCVSVRVHGNKMRNVFSGVSIVPLFDGPVYITGNDIMYGHLMVKMNGLTDDANGHAFVYHNSGFAFGDHETCPLSTGIAFQNPVHPPNSAPVGRQNWNFGNRHFANNAIYSTGWAVRNARRSDINGVYDTVADNSVSLNSDAYAYSTEVEARFTWIDPTSGTESTFLALEPFAQASGYDANGQGTSNLDDFGWLNAPALTLACLQCPEGAAAWSDYRDWRPSQFVNCEALYNADLMPSWASSLRGNAIPITGLSLPCPDIGAYEADCGQSRLYGDCAPEWCIVDVSDVLCVLAGYSNYDSCPLGDIVPCCREDGIIEVGDVVALLDAVNGNYACPHPCPGCP